MSATSPRRLFTGWHMTFTLVAFFGTVVAVNLVMANFAIGTFGGTVVPNSYVASQKFNGWLAEGRRQSALGWDASVTRDLAGRVEVRAHGRHGEPLTGLMVKARAVHPLGRAATTRLVFDPAGDAYRSRAILPAGRWLLTVEFQRGKDRLQLESRLN